MVAQRNNLDESAGNVLELDAVPVVEDIDPADWLSDNSGAIVDSFELRNGKSLKIAALTEAEEAAISKGSLRPDKSDPRRKVREFSLYKREFVAASVNKAYGRHMGENGYVTSQQLAARPIGELTQIMTAIMRISGMDVEAPQTDSGFFA